MEWLIGGLVAVLIIAGIIALARWRKREAPVTILGVVEPPSQRVVHAWYVPLSPVEEEELAWERDRALREDMEKDA